MKTSIDADAVKLAGLQVDLLQKIRQGHVTLGHLEWFVGITKERREQLMGGGAGSASSLPVDREGFRSFRDSIVTIRVPEKYSPNWFQGVLRRSTRFMNLVGVKAEPVSAGTVYKIFRNELSKKMSTSDIELVLPTQHLFNATDVCAVIAGLINDQPAGQTGPLQTESFKDNLFFLRDCIVRVYWQTTVNDGWYAETYEHTDHVWDSNCRIFYPASSQV